MAKVIDNTFVLTRSIQTRWHSASIWWLSPLFLSMANLGLAFAAVMLPPHWLSGALHENDLCFLSPDLMLVIVVSEASFFLGILLASKLFDHGRIAVRRSPLLNPTKSILFMANILTGIVIIGELLLATTLIERVGLAHYVFAFGNPVAGLNLRENIVTMARIGGVNVLAIENFFLPALMLVIFIYLSLQSRKQRLLGMSYAIFGLIMYIFVNALTLTRWQILQGLLSVIVVYVFYKNSRKGMKLTRILRVAIYFILFATLLFLGVNQLKTTIHGDNAIVGYVFGSYNNAAGVISGVIRPPFSDSTYVTLGALWNAPFAGGNIRTLGSSLGLDLPNAKAGAMIVWSGWTNSLTKAGLNPVYQWDTVFGAIYGDVGLLFPFVFFFYGFVSQYFFVNAIKLRLFHFLIYIFIIVSLVTWFTSVFISNTTFDDYAIFSLVLYLIFKSEWRRSIHTTNGQII